MIYGVILCVGDSLVTGARNELGLSVARLLGDELCIRSNGQRWIGVDEGINGETTSSLLRRFYRIVRSYPEAKDVVLCIGINDAKDPGVPAQVFKRNYTELLRTLDILKKKCYACLIPHRDGFGAPDYVSNDLIDEYNEIIRKVAGHSVAIVDLTVVPSKCRADGIHFNFEGDEWVAKKIAAAIIAARS